jgi:hypothetical protein
MIVGEGQGRAVKGARSDVTAIGPQLSEKVIVEYTLGRERAGGKQGYEKEGNIIHDPEA